MSRGKRRTYTQEYKREAVERIEIGREPQVVVARDLGIPEQTLANWRKSKNVIATLSSRGRNANTIKKRTPTGERQPGNKVSQPRRSRGSDTREIILYKAARVFSEHGYEATTMREIAASIGVASGSLYHHFSSKEQLISEVYKAGIEQLSQALKSTISTVDDPWKRLELACALHIEALVNTTPYAAVLSRDMPRVSKRLIKTLIAYRDEYEELFKLLFDDLGIRSEKRRRLLRLEVLGAINWTLQWYRKDGGCTPKEIASQFIGNLRRD